MATLLEKYSKRLSIAEKVYKNTHNGQSLDRNRMITTAQCLENVSKYMTEALDNSVGVQRNDLGLFRKFALNLTNVAVPSLIISDIMMVKPMTAMSGYRL